MSLPAAVASAAQIAASPAGALATRPVVLTLYRNLLRLSQRYGVVAQQSKQTVQHELDRLLPTQSPSASASSSAASAAGKAVQVAAIPIQTAAGPAIAIAISPARDDSSTATTPSTASTPATSPSELPSVARLLSSSTPALDPSGVMSASIAARMVQAQFRMHGDERRPAHIQRQLSQAFTALRKLKDRHNALAALTHSSTSAARTTYTAHIAQSTPLAAGQSVTTHSTPNFSVTESSITPPLLHSLHTATTTDSSHTRIHIAASHSRSTPLRVASSSPSTPSHLFTYTLTITNVHSSAAIQLLSRRWLFTDSSGRQQQVTGEGVVGRQPVLEPQGGSFQYTSGVSLAERKGRMEGSLRFRVVQVDTPPAKKKGRGGRGGKGKSRQEGREENGVGSVEVAAAESEEASEQLQQQLGEGERVGDEFEASVGPILLDGGESEHERVG